MPTSISKPSIIVESSKQHRNKSVMDQLVEKFHNIGGSSVAEHYKNFNVYTKELQNANFDVDEFFSKLVPLNRQESNFRIKLLQKYSRTRELFETFMNGDKISCLLIIKDARFLDCFKGMSGGDFVTQICINVSFVMRCKLINKLSYSIRDVEIGKDYFQCVQNKYGLKIAKPLLVACDESFIKDTVTTYEITFSQRQLIFLHKKYPSFIRFYFTDYPFLEQHKVLSQYLCLNDLEMFHELLKKSTPKIGKSAFGKFLCVYKDEVVNDPDKIKFLFNRRKIYKILKPEEYATFFRNMLPKSVEDFDNDLAVRAFLKYMPRKARGQFLFNAFKEAYCFDIYPTTHFLGICILDILHPNDASKFELEDDYIEFLAIEKSIPSIKLKISLTSEMSVRSKLLLKLLETCKFHENIDELLEVLKYFCRRHKNENSSVRTEFLQLLTDSFTLEKLGKEHWKYISELILFTEINDDSNYSLQKMIQKYIHYKILNGEDYTSELKMYWKRQSHHYLEIFWDKADYQKLCYFRYLSLVDEMYNNDEKILNEAKVALLDAVLHLNTKHPQHSIPFKEYSNLFDVLMVTDLDVSYLRLENVLKIAAKEPNEYNRNVILNSIKKLEIKYFGADTFKLFLKLIPQSLIERQEFIFKNGMADKRMWYEISKMHYTKLHESFTQYALDCLGHQKRDVEEIWSSINAIVFHKPDVVLDFAKKFLPDPECKINVHEENMKDTLVIQKCLLKSFKSISLFPETLKLTLHHCNADYLQYATQPLSYILYYLPEKDVELPILELLTRSGSVRKQAIHLATNLTCSKLKYDILKTIIEKEKAPSVKKFIFKNIRVSFLSDRSNEEYKLLTENFNLLDVEDKESLTLLHKFDGVPLKFYDNYTQCVWTYLKDLKDYKEFELLKNLKLKRLFSSTFCDEVVRHSLFNEKNHSQQETYNFVYKYLVYANDLLEHRIRVVCGCINNLTEINDSFAGFGTKMKNIYNLFETICLEIISKKSDESVVIDKISDNMDELKMPYGKLNLEMLIETTKCYTHLEVAVDPIEPLAKFILAQQKVIIQKYGQNVIILHGRFLKIFINYIFNQLDGRNEENFLSLVNKVIEMEDSSNARLLALQFLDLKEFKNPLANQRQNDFINKIAHNCSKTVELHLCNIYCNM